MFALFSITLFSQTKKVNFENELVYKIDDHHIICYVSNKYTTIELVSVTYTSDNILYYSGKNS